MFRFCLLLLAVWQVNAASKLKSVTCSDVGISNCGSCDLPDVDCYACAPGNVMNTDYSGCTRCPSNCAVCSWGKSTTIPVCNLCMPGYIQAKDGSCTSCGSYCTSCIWSTAKTPVPLCTACANVNGITLGSITQQCLICPANCQTCFEVSSGTTQCTQCLPGYFSTTSGCSSCPSFCIQCSPSAKSASTGSCSACMTGYTLNSADPTQACLIWPASCKAVNGIVSSSPGVSQCTSCNDGYYYSSFSCLLCPTGCSKCTSASVCTACEEDFTLSGTTCKACTFGCHNCDGGLLQCNLCETYWGNQNTGLLSCTLCPLNCASCSAPGVCDTCYTGYFVDVDGSCGNCPANCASCSSATYCDTCKVKYQASNGVCYLCDTNCASQSSCQAASSGIKCTSCATGYYVSGNACQKCITGCSSCSDSSTCDVCMSGWYLASDSTCIECSVDNCDECDGEWNCTACATGYFVDPQQQCTACEDNCDHCSDATTCTTCSATFRLDGANCYACDANCATPLEDVGLTLGNCNNTNACSLCKTGYVTDGYACQTCPSNCLQSGCKWSKVDMSTYCTACESKFYVSSGACAACKAGCSKCSGTPCSACISNFVLGGSNCYSCPANCFSGCSYTTAFTNYNSQCGTCDDYYIASALDGQCHSCPSNCITCTFVDAEETQQQCQTCDEGYGLKDNLCLPCPFYCSSCSVKTAGGNLVCDTCDAGYAINNLPCGQCTPNCKACSNVNGNMVCSQCNDYYTIASDGTCAPCPTSCSKCAFSGSKTICASGACDVGTGRTFDGSACQICSTLAFTGCSICSDQPAQGVPASCTDCSDGYILNYWATSCLSTGSLQNCLIPGARPHECTLTGCQAPFTWITSGPAKGMCGLECSVCGDIDSGDFRPASECQATNGNYTKEAIPDGCWVARKMVNGQAVYARGGTMQYNCTDEYSNEVVLSSGLSLLCCSSGADCNGDLQLDGVAGASAVAVSITLLLASIFVAIRLF